MSVEASSLEQEQRQNHMTVETPRVLVVDDHPANVEILEILLADEFRLETAGTGAEALEKAERFNPDVVLLDVMMPGMNGYETCRMLRQMIAGRNCTIIMVSARAMNSEREEGIRAGADEYVTKPFDVDHLLRRIRGIFSIGEAGS